NGLSAGFNASGTVGMSFASGGIHRANINQNGSDGITQVVVMTDGKILVAGFTEFPFSPYKIYFLRYNSNGTLDMNFGNEGYTIIDGFGVNQDLPAFMGLQSNGKIIVVSTVDTSQFSKGSI